MLGDEVAASAAVLSARRST